MSEIKRQFPMLKGITYLNSSLAGIPHLSVTNAMKRSIDDWSRLGLHWHDSMDDILAIKGKFAKLIGVDAHEIAIIPSVSAGLVAIASSLNLSGERSNAVVSSLNFAVNKVIWQGMEGRGLLRDVRLLEKENGEIPIESYEKSIDDHTAVVAVDYVSGFNGYVERVKEISEIAQSHGAILVVDAFHAAGALPVDARKLGIDVLLCGFSKWMCGPPGAACLYVNRRLLGKLEPSYLGWQGIKGNIIERKLAGKDLFRTPFQYPKPSSSAARFEWGSWSPVVLKGVREAIGFVLESDQSLRYSTILKRKKELVEGLEELGFDIVTPEDSATQGGGIVAFQIKNEKAFASQLAAKNVIIAANFGRVVVSPHFYNSREDVDRFLELARAFRPK